MKNIYLRVHNGVTSFSGNADCQEVFKATVEMAESCRFFQMDVEDEIVYEDQTTCYNCRYRRWTKEGFSCYKDFQDILQLGGE